MITAFVMAATLWGGAPPAPELDWQILEGDLHRGPGLLLRQGAGHCFQMLRTVDAQAELLPPLPARVRVTGREITPFGGDDMITTLVSGDDVVDDHHPCQRVLLVYSIETLP